MPRQANVDPIRTHEPGPVLTHRFVRWRYVLADRRLDRALHQLRCAVRLKYDPGQPRVPAGNPDGGQWTDGGGRGGSADTGRDDRVRVAQVDRVRRRTIILEDEERRGGHTIRRHVGKTDQELIDRMDRMYARRRVGRFEITQFVEAVGSFTDVRSANNFVNLVLEENSEIVDEVAMGKITRKAVEHRFGYVTGKEAFRSTGDSRAIVR